MKVLVLHAPALPLAFVGCYGNDWIATPALDRLASEGIVFDSHFSANPALPRHTWTGRVLPSESLKLPALLESQGIGFHHLESQTLEAALEATLAAVLERADDERWLLWVDLSSLAPPWSVAEEFLQLYFPDEELEPGEEPIEPWLDPPIGLSDLDDFVQGERLRSTCAAAVTQLDGGLGLLFEELRRQELLDELLVIVCSERGQALGEHGVIGDARPDVHEEIIHVPLLMRLPEAAEAGRRMDALTSTIDLLPTLLDFFQVPMPPLQGLSLLPLLHGQAGKLRDYLCCGCGKAWALRTPRQCLIVPGDEQPSQLFIKPDDRWEVNDVRQHHPERVEALESTLRAWIEAAQRPGPLQAPPLPE